VAFTRRSSDGPFPADFVPATPEKGRPAGADNLGQRLENMGVTKTTALQKVRAASHLEAIGDRNAAEYLGLDEFYDRIAAIREKEAAETGTQ
jgi:hypothetical protein